MYEMSMDQVFAEVEKSIEQNDLKRAETLLFPALDQFSDLPQCYFHAGNIFFRSDRPGLAALCYERSIELDPNPHVMANYGAALRQMNLNERSLEVLEKAREFDPENPSLWTNICACYVNEGNPKPGIEAGENALKYKPDFARALWNLGLLYLEDGQFEKGWSHYRKGLGKERMVRNYTDGDEPEFLSPELHEQHKGAGKRVIVWGEQGIGDELMMGSMLYDLKMDYEVVFDCHPRLEWLHRKAHPELRIYPTRKDEWIDWPVTDEVKADFKCGLGDLGVLYRKRLEDFPAGQFYFADEKETAGYRLLLESVAGGRKIVGLATRGGVIKTMRWYRSVNPDLLRPLLNRKDLMFVSLDYEDVEEQCTEINREFGEGTIYNFPAITQHFDYHHTAALVQATDYVVSVCQSVAHLSAGMGHETHVLTPSKPAWRYGARGEEWYWYRDRKIRLYRQEGDDWTRAIADVGGAL